MTKTLLTLSFVVAAILLVCPYARGSEYPPEEEETPGWTVIERNNWTPEEWFAHVAEVEAIPPDPELDGISTNEAERTSEIRAMARALNNDRGQIFDWVRNNIDYVPYFGSQNGATATLLARRGNDIDQCSLLIALLKAASPTLDVHYATAKLVYTKSFVANLLGVDTNQVVDVLRAGGIPCDHYQGTNVWLVRYWVRSPGTLNYWLDPAFKPCTNSQPLAFETAMGYNRTSFVASALMGATETGDSLRSVNENNVRSNLTRFAMNLAGYFKTNYPASEVEDLLGRRRIVQKTYTNWPTAMEYYIAYSPSTRSNYTVLPEPCFVKLRVTHAGIDRTFKSYEIADKRVSIFYTGANNAPQLTVDGAVVATGNATTPGQTYWMTNRIIIPNATVTNVRAYRLASGSYYVLAHNFGGASSRLLARENDKLLKDRASGAADTSEAVLGGSLNNIALSYYHQTTLLNNLLARLLDVVGITYYEVGLAAQESSYYIDLKQVGCTFNHATGNTAKALAWFRTSALVDSALEHGALEQLQGYDQPAVSTVKLLGINNSSNNETYLAVYTNWSGGSGVRSRLVNYSSNELAKLDTYILTDRLTGILPKNGAINLLQWTGDGYAVFSTNRTAMLIEGGLKGAFGADDWFIDPNEQGSDVYFNYGATPLDNRFSFQDPVDSLTGNLLFDHTDLELSGEPPKGISFRRSYNSGNASVKSLLGYGGAHNLDIRVQQHSHADVAMGARTPVDMAPMLAFAVVVKDMMENENPLRAWMIDALAAKWATDQLANNAVSVLLGDNTLEYLRMPNGDFNSPANTTARLVLTNNVFRLEERFGKTFEFNAANQLSRWMDADSNTLNCTYNAQANLESVSDCFGRAMTFTYNASTQLIRVADSTGRTISYGYSQGCLSSFTDAAGYVWTYTYDTNRWMTLLRDPMGTITASNTYDNLGRVTSQKNGAGYTWNFYVAEGYRSIEEAPDGTKTTYWLDGKNRVTAIDDPLGNRKSFRYNGHDQVVAEWDARSNLTVRQYDLQKNLTNVIDSLNRATAYTYDSHDRLVKVRDPLGHETQTQYDSEHHPERQIDALSNETVFAYYPNGFLQTRTEPRGIVTSYTYDTNGYPDGISRAEGGTVSNQWNARGDLVQSWDALGHVTTYAWDARRLKVSERDPLGYAISNVYNAAGLLITNIDKRGVATAVTWTPTYKEAGIRYADGGAVSNLYDSSDRLLAVRDQRGFWTSNRYDAAGRLIAVIDALGRVTSNVYDKSGNVIVMRDAKGYVTSNQYDALNRIMSVRDPLGYVSSNQYDEAGRVTATFDKQGKRTQFDYDALNRKTTITRPNGAVDRFEYDATGNQVAYQNPEGNRISFGYDRMNRLTSEPNAVGLVKSKQYDVVGNIILRTDAQSRQTRYEYDAANRLTNTVYPNGSKNSFTYLNDGKLSKACSSLATNMFAYDSLGRMTQAVFYVLSGASTVSYSYDLAGNRTALVYAGNKNMTTVFNPLNQATNVQAVSMGITNAAYSFDQVGNLTGVGLAAGNVNSTLTPDALGRISSYACARGASNFIQRSITRNGAGIKTAETILVGYHPLPSATRQTQEHNAADQLTSVSELADGTWDDAVLSHDADGNVIQALHSVSGQVMTSVYRWDYDNHLVYASSGVASVSFSYDALGNLVGMERNGANTFFVRDYADPLKRPLMQVNSAGLPQRYFVWSNGRLLAQVETNGAMRYAHFDELGNLLALTDAGGNVTDQFYYEGYGKLRARTGSTEIPFTWLGAYGVIYAGDDLFMTLHRAYHAGIMRFLSVDPLGISGSLNLYLYGNANPLFFLDMLGWCAERYQARTDALQGAQQILAEEYGPIFNFFAQHIIGSMQSGVNTAYEAERTGLSPNTSLTLGAVQSVGQTVAQEASAVIVIMQAAKAIGEALTSPPSHQISPPQFSSDPSRPPAQGYEWRGRGPPGSNQGSWYNPSTGESYHPDLGHGDPIGPHYDYTAPDGTQYRIFPDGTIKPK